MIVHPRVKGYICTTAHPLGCAKYVHEQIAAVKNRGRMTGGPKRALIIGASTGYGLASRIASAFGWGAATLGVYFEKPAEEKRTATAGWYNMSAFEDAARSEGLYARGINGDAFSDEVKLQVAETIQRDLGQVDLVIYSVATSRRTHPKTGETFKSVLKPVGAPYKNKSLDLETEEVIDIELEKATDEEIRQTVAVMGGEDWEMWMDLLMRRDLLARNTLSMAYSYIGPDATHPIYRQGTIGAAKDHLEKKAKELDSRLARIGGRAIVSVNKAVVTQASSAIPFLSLYLVLLFKVMKRKGLHEGCIEQIDRLFRDKLLKGPLSKNDVDNEGRIRMDDLELRADVQREVKALWDDVNSQNVHEFGDIVGYNQDFLKLFGFGMSGINYDNDIEIDVKIS